MLHKTKGIVLKTTNYGDTSVLVKVYTEKFGLQSYIIQSVKKPKSKIKMNMLQPLTLLDMVVYMKANSNIHRISEAQCSPILKTIPYQILKSSIALFINEILYKSLKQALADEEIFNFLYQSICFLDEVENNYANFPLVFLVKYSAFLGFEPNADLKNNSINFDLVNGAFTSKNETHQQYIDKEYLLPFHKLLSTPINQLDKLKINNKERKYFLKKLLSYYSLHLDDFGEINSHHILEEILS